MSFPTFTQSCTPCKDTGWVSAIHKETFQNYAFQCGMCFRASNLRLSKNIPVWSSKQKEKFERYDEFVKRGGFQEIKDRAEGKSILPLVAKESSIISETTKKLGEVK